MNLFTEKVYPVPPRAMDPRSLFIWQCLIDYLSEHGPSTIKDVERGLNWHHQKLQRCLKKHGLPDCVKTYRAKRRYFCFIRGQDQAYSCKLMALKEPATDD